MPLLSGLRETTEAGLSYPSPSFMPPWVGRSEGIAEVGVVVEPVLLNGDGWLGL